MLKIPAATAGTLLHRSRIVLAAASASASASAISKVRRPNMTSSEGSVRAGPRPQDVPDHLKQTKPERPTTYFPLGYKDAAYQWVCHLAMQIRL